MDLIDYSNKVQEALHQGNNDEYNTLVDKYGKNKATYKEIEESFSSIVDGMLKRDALFNAVYLSGINVIIKYLADRKILSPSDINAIKQAISKTIKDANDKAKGSTGK